MGRITHLTKKFQCDIMLCEVIFIMKKIWTGDVRIKYPKQWIVMVNLNDDKKGCKVMGEIYLVTSDKNEAYKTAAELDSSMGRNLVIEGYDNAQSQLGGLWSL